LQQQTPCLCKAGENPLFTPTLTLPPGGGGKFFFNFRYFSLSPGGEGRVRGILRNLGPGHGKSLLEKTFRSRDYRDAINSNASGALPLKE
jgi:hypothetical protein